MLQDYCYWISVYRQNSYQSTLPTMVFLLGASSLSAYNTLSYRTKKIYKGSFFAAPCLSFNHKDKIKNVNYLLQKEHGKLKRKNDIVKWHDVINNSITPHKSNNNIGLTTEELTQMLLSQKDKINSIIYCQRIATNKIFKSLLKTKILVIDAKKKKKISHRNSQNSFICFQLQQIHPCKKLESKLMLIVWTKRNNLKSLVYKSKKLKPSKKERKKIRERKSLKKTSHRKEKGKERKDKLRKQSEQEKHYR